jgi:hypothetical protein
MNFNEPVETGCAVCGKGVSHVPGVAHVYHEGRRFALCCPMCIEMFQRAPARFANGERPQTVVEDLIEEIKWRTGP